MTRRVLSLSAAAVLVLGTAGNAAAQTSVTYEITEINGPTFTGTPVKLLVSTAGAVPPVVVSEKAERLQREAVALFSQPKKQWKRAAGMLEQSAALRNANDPDAYSCLVYAGRIKATLGDMSGARANMEKAAAHAMARGAIVDAAQAYIDAAQAAVALGDALGAQDLVGRATLLLNSPMLTVSQRELLKSRLAAA